MLLLSNCDLGRLWVGDDFISQLIALLIAPQKVIPMPLFGAGHG